MATKTKTVPVIENDEQWGKENIAAIEALLEAYDYLDTATRRASALCTYADKTNKGYGASGSVTVMLVSSKNARMIVGDVLNGLNAAATEMAVTELFKMAEAVKKSE